MEYLIGLLIVVGAVALFCIHNLIDYVCKELIALKSRIDELEARLSGKGRI